MVTDENEVSEKRARKEKRLRDAIDQFVDVYMEADWLMKNRFARLADEVVRIAME
jgi:hypothetical protein